MSEVPDRNEGRNAGRHSGHNALPSPIALARDLLIIAFFTLAMTWALRFGLDTFLGSNLDNVFWLRDYLGNLAVAFIAFALVGSLRGTLVLTALIVVSLQLANGGKLAVLGTPTSPDDFINVVNLYHLAEGWSRVAVIAILAAPVLALLWLFRWRSVVAWSTVALLAGVIALIHVYPQSMREALDRRFGNSVWNQPENFKRRGLALHIVQESVRTLAKVGKVPDEATVTAALDGLERRSPDLGGATRNVHVIVLESFFDPLSLGSDWVAEDPFPQEFRALWAETGNSQILSPVFGGYTANAEFEVLCGYPVTENAVFFEGWLRRDVPCLPDVLRSAGYRTVASHPNVPGFWNRTHAYRLTGFDEYLSKQDFDLSDSVGNFLLDHSYYEQVFDQLGPLAEQPLFNYMLTYHGHLPFPGGESYPDKLEPAQDAPLLKGYLNQVWYKSRDLMARLDVLRREDPDALIVAFGDHVPFLGPNYGVYDDALGLPESRDDFSGEQLKRLVTTPLIVIDGQRGPLELGTVPLYRLPSLMLDLLGAPSGGMLDWTANPDGETIRPVYGMHIAIKGSDAMACPPETTDQACATSADWLARTRTLIGDIFTGKQIALRGLEAGNTDSVAKGADGATGPDG